jgi:hypothetical protein
MHSGASPVLLLSPPVVVLLLPLVDGSTPVVLSVADTPTVVSTAPIVVSVPVRPCVPTVSSPGVVVPGVVEGPGPADVELDESETDVEATSSGVGAQASNEPTEKASVRRIQEVMGRQF